MEVSVAEPLSARLLYPTPSLTSVPQHPHAMAMHTNDNGITTTPIAIVHPTTSPKISDLNSSSLSTTATKGRPGWGFSNSHFNLIPCQLEYNEFLDRSTELDKWASGVATTLMTMLPSMIAFGPLRTADTQTLYYLNTLVALVTCGFTLLFRVDSWTTLRKDRIWRVTDILDEMNIDMIYGYTRSGSGCPPSLPAANIDIPTLKRLYDSGRLEKLQQDAFGTSALSGGIESGSTITTGIQNWQNEGRKKRRPTRTTVYMVTTVFGFIQSILFLAITSWVFMINSTLFIWGCAGDGYMIYCRFVAWSFEIATVVRYASTSQWMRPDEIFYIESISASPARCCCDGASALSSNPIPERTAHSNWSLIKLAQLKSNLIQFRVKRRKEQSGLLRIMLNIWSLELERLNKPHPMVLVIRPACESAQKKIAIRWLSGYLQVLHLGAVSFLFGSITLSSLFLTLGFVATFISAIAFSRLASILMADWLEKRLGLTIIEYRSEMEWIAIWVVINSMPDCLVESKNSPYRYANGYRPHLCTKVEEDPRTATKARSMGRSQRNIPIPDTNMLKTTPQMPDVKTVCTFCSVALAFVFAVSLGFLIGIVWSYSFTGGLSANASYVGGSTAGASFMFLVWWLWAEFESASGYGQALQWAGGCNPAT
ncbi:hypothetical protein HOY82DRAFT_621011 [Tuber indicum]|nr:hypothetical protein HOY82DRAFT_621011 [Tuber indicum]